jgi:hypothetical protein
MNYSQLFIFFLFFFSVLSLGTGFYNSFFKGKVSYLNKLIFLGEVLLIGGSLFVSELLLLSILGLYRPFFIFGVLVGNFVLLFRPDVRSGITGLFTLKLHFNVASFVFILLAAAFIYRNCFFVFDIDSISTYLFTQKLWLVHGGSIFGSSTDDIRIFVPHFDYVPTSLGIILFGQETLFPALINIFWRLIVLILVFGYTSYRFNNYYALAASLFVIFDPHYFYSGVNRWVLINGALIALLFASVYNFWEARVRNCPFRFILALIFLFQLLANKYQMIFVFPVVLFMGLLVQNNPRLILKGIFLEKRKLLILGIFLFGALLFYLKNWLAIGDPFFPGLADRFGTFGFTGNMAKTYMKVWGGISLFVFFKYMNYLFIWPGVMAAKYVILAISLLPVILVYAALRRNVERENVLELGYWLSLPVLILMAVCVFCHQDPRFYRFPLAIFAFAAVFSIDYLFRQSLGFKKGILLSSIIIVFSLLGYRTPLLQGGNFNYPSFKENAGVIMNKLHTDYAIRRDYPYIPDIVIEFDQNKDKTGSAAWEGGPGMNFPAFFMPLSPKISFWFTNIIKWESYNNPQAVIKDLGSCGIKWVMRISQGHLVFVPAVEFAKEKITFERYPKKIFYDYDFPAELSQIRWN